MIHNSSEIDELNSDRVTRTVPARSMRIDYRPVTPIRRCSRQDERSLSFDRCVPANSASGTLAALAPFSMKCADAACQAVMTTSTAGPRADLEIFVADAFDATRRVPALIIRERGHPENRPAR